MEIVIGIVVGLAVGAVIAVIAMRNAKNGSLREADSRIESARAEADQVIGEAQRQAETLKKEALLEAKEEIIQNKQAAEAEEKQRKRELRALENRMTGETMRSTSASTSFPARPGKLRSAAVSSRTFMPSRPKSSSASLSSREMTHTVSFSIRSAVRLPMRRRPSFAIPSSR